MKFGPMAVSEAEGAILAHSVAAGGQRLRKGKRITREDIEALSAAGVEEIVAAVLAPGDLGEDEAAERIAAALKISNVEAKPAATGRVNLHAISAGVFTVSRDLVDAINRIDPAVTLATLAEFSTVAEGRMVATVKIIPFAVAGTIVEQAEKIAASGEAFAVHSFRPARVAVIQTQLPGVKPSILDKTARVTAERLARSGSRIVAERRVGHVADELAHAIAAVAGDADMILAFGASAVSDSADVIPAAIRKAGGSVSRIGMPVDPGNLLVLGELGGRPVLGAPGCARSPKENGFDWVLDRMLAGLDVSDTDIASMGVGGLLMEIETRPQPREPAPPKVEVHAVLLAAGRSSRMGGPNKLLALFGDVPLVRRTAERALASRVKGVTVVTGHQSERVRAALAGFNVAFSDNPEFAAGLSSSLKAGVNALPASASGALVVLADMPDITAADLDRLIDAFAACGGRRIVRATYAGKRGNPVILPRSLFDQLAAIEGDIGARHIVEAAGVDVIDVEIGEGASVDVDTPEALELAGGKVA